jgi:hypothetical protein
MIETHIAMHWTENQEDLLYGWLKKINNYSKINKLLGERYECYSYMINIPIIVISVITAAETYAMLGEQDESTTIKIIRAVGSTIVAGLSFLNNLLKCEKISEKHYTISIQYDSLKNDIEDQLTRPVEYRDNLTLYISRVKMEYNNLLNGTPPISVSLLKKYNVSSDLIEDSELSMFSPTRLTPDSIQNIKINNLVSPGIIVHNMYGNNTIPPKPVYEETNNSPPIIGIFTPEFSLRRLTSIQKTFEEKLEQQRNDNDIKRINYELSRLSNR